MILNVYKSNYLKQSEHLYLLFCFSFLFFFSSSLSGGAWSSTRFKPCILLMHSVYQGNQQVRMLKHSEAPNLNFSDSNHLLLFISQGLMDSTSEMIIYYIFITKFCTEVLRQTFMWYFMRSNILEFFKIEPFLCQE